MNACFRTILSVFLVFQLVPSSHAQAQPATGSRLVLAADAGWKFLLGDPKGAEQTGFADSAWRTVDLPHDWSIEGRPEKTNPTGAGGGFYPAGIGWYRRSFNAPPVWTGKRVSIEFDGVYRNATVYLNGHALGTHPYGYTSFAIDLTPSLKLRSKNLLAVRVDNSAQPNSRWYSGSGIYRHVRLVVTDPVHIAHWGTFVTTSQISQSTATVAVQTTVANDSAAPTQVTLDTTLLDPAGKPVGKTSSPLALAPGKTAQVDQTVRVAAPALWSPASPSVYRALSVVQRNGVAADQEETSFGIRSLSWSADTGLLLNGTAVKLTGGSVHHDNGPLGAAAFDRAEVRKAELLKAAGYNAVRTAHNQPSPAFLDACDRLGLLVLDEPFDTWKAHKVKFDYGSDFDTWSKQDIAALVLRDRNHPSIVVWGIGNEIPELETAQGKEIAKSLAEEVRALDNTRPLTLAFPGTTTLPNAQAVFSQLDIVGYNYNLLQTYIADHQQFPSRLMLTTESYPAKAFALWQASHDHSYVLGDLTWTAMDYLGESGIGAWSYGTAEEARTAEQIMGAMVNASVIDKLFLGMAQGSDMNAALAETSSDPATKGAMQMLFHGYPWHAAACGDIDLIGVRKPQSFYRDILWNGGDRVYATVRLPEPEGKKIVAVGWATYPTAASWSWPGQEGKPLQLEVYSGAEQVRLFLNDKLIGEAPVGREQEFKAIFSVPFTPGTLKAIALRGGLEVAQSVLTTAGPASALRITADRQAVDADGQDLAYLLVEAVDAQGRFQPNANQEIQFSLAGPGVIAAVGNGDGQDNASYHATTRKLFGGQALVIVRSSTKPGPLSLSAGAPGLVSATAHLETRQAPPHAVLQ